LSRASEQPLEGDELESAMRRLTLTRMLIWAAHEAREIDCFSSADHLDRALNSIADCIRDREFYQSA
jgi:hypothetical protein